MQDKVDKAGYSYHKIAIAHNCDVYVIFSNKNKVSGIK